MFVCKITPSSGDVFRWNLRKRTKKLKYVQLTLIENPLTITILYRSVAFISQISHHHCYKNVIVNLVEHCSRRKLRFLKIRNTKLEKGIHNLNYNTVDLLFYELQNNRTRTG